MCRDISVACIVRVLVLLLHVSVLRNSGNKQPKGDCNKNASPECFINSVPHLLVQKMDLLHSLDVILLSWSIGQCPNSQIVHVGHLCPGVFELWSFFQKFIFESWLGEILIWSKELLENLGGGLHVV